MGEMNMVEVWTNPVGNIVARLFTLYLLAAFCVTLLRSIRLAVQLGSIRPTGLELGDEQAENVERVAQAAPKKGIGERLETAAWTSESAGFHRPAASFDPDRVEARFAYLWDTCNARVQATKALAAITIVLSIFPAVWGVFNICRVLMGDLDPIVALAYWRDLFFLICPGFFVAAFLCASAFWFQGALARRRTDWNYARSKFRDGWQLKQ